MILLRSHKECQPECYAILTNASLGLASCYRDQNEQNKNNMAKLFTGLHESDIIGMNKPSVRGGGLSRCLFLWGITSVLFYAWCSTNRLLPLAQSPRRSTMLAAMPVREGKVMLFKMFTGVDAFSNCLTMQNTEEIVRIVKAITMVFVGINLDGVSAHLQQQELNEHYVIPSAFNQESGRVRAPGRYCDGVRIGRSPQKQRQNQDVNLF
jgi:hypothetical protein